MAERRRGLLRQAHQAPPQARYLPLGRRPPGRHQPLHRRAQRHRGQTLHPARRPQRHHRRQKPRVPNIGAIPLGLGEAPACMTDLVCATGGQVSAGGRLLFPPELVEAALEGVRRNVTLCGRATELDLSLVPTSVHVGSGGAVPTIFDRPDGPLPRLHTGRSL